MSRYIGVDLHTNSFTVCYYETEDKMEFKTYKLIGCDLLDFKSNLKPSDELAVEATGNTEYFLDCLSDQKLSRVLVANPRQFNVIRKSVSKTDKKDAKAIAYFLSKDMLPACRRKEKFCQRVASLSQTRDKLVKSRTYFLNKIHGILNMNGVKLRRESLCTQKGLSKVLTLEIDETSQFEIKLLVEQVQSLSKSIKEADKQLVVLGSRLKGHANLVSIKGIGARSASILLSVIGDISEFESEAKLGSYFGIVPKVSSSNETTHHGRITKRGSKLGRTTLVQCTLIAIRYSEYLRTFYERVKSRKGSGKAIIATSKKMLGIIYNTLKNDWIFADFGNFVIEKPA